MAVVAGHHGRDIRKTEISSVLDIKNELSSGRLLANYRERFFKRYEAQVASYLKAHGSIPAGGAKNPDSKSYRDCFLEYNVIECIKAEVNAVKLFMSTVSDEEDNCRMNRMLDNIIKQVAIKSGIDRVIRFKESDFAVAFSGPSEHPKLLLMLYMTKSGRSRYITASIDDETTWDSCDYVDDQVFATNLVDYIAPRMNQTVKTVTEIKKRRYIMQKEYILNKQTGEWEILSTTCWGREYSKLAALFLFTDKHEEKICEYSI